MNNSHNHKINNLSRNNLLGQLFKKIINLILIRGFKLPLAPYIVLGALFPELLVKLMLKSHYLEPITKTNYRK